MPSLSDNLEVMRLWWAAYVHDGVTLTPEAVAGVTRTLGDLKEQAERYEDMMVEARMLCLAVRGDALARREKVATALAAKGLSDRVAPASALLTVEHLSDPKIRVLVPRAAREEQAS